MKKTKGTREELKTEAMNNVNTRVDNKNDPFRRLPEELLLTIFGKVADLKCLCQCSLVSKHFASVISHVRTVSLAISSGSGTYTKESFQTMGKFLSELHHSSPEQIPTILESLSLQNLKLPMFLQKLRGLEFIYLECEYPQNGANPPFLLQKIKFVGNSAKIENFVALVPSGSIHKDTEDEPDHEEQESVGNYTNVSERIMECIGRLYGHYIEWMCILLMLVKNHISLHRVTIVDSKVHGKLVIGDGQLVHLQCGVLDELWDHLSRNITRVAWLPILHLPLSGYVMRWVALLIVDAPTNPQVLGANKLDEILFSDSEDELKVLREAVKEILKKDRVNIRLEPFFGHVQNQ